MESKDHRAEWVGPEAFPFAGMPAALAALITETGSLTEKLRCGGPARFGFRVLTESFRDARSFPEHKLGAQAGRVLLREVCLLSSDRPAVFAQTLVPELTLGRHPWLGELGEEPLGSQLFSRQDVRREPFEFTRLSRGHPLARRALAMVEDGPETAGELWARRSLFRIAGLPVSVNEVFFPLPAVTEA